MQIENTNMYSAFLLLLNKIQFSKFNTIEADDSATGFPLLGVKADAKQRNLYLWYLEVSGLNFDSDYSYRAIASSNS